MKTSEMIKSSVTESLNRVLVEVGLWKGFKGFSCLELNAKMSKDAPKAFKWASLHYNYQSTMLSPGLCPLGWLSRPEK